HPRGRCPGVHARGLDRPRLRGGWGRAVASREGMAGARPGNLGHRRCQGQRRGRRQRHRELELTRDGPVLLEAPPGSGGPSHRDGGHLVFISPASPPPWAGKYGPQLLSARDDSAELDLPSDEWTLEEAGERSRPATGPDGQHAELIDAVLVARRR